MASAGTGGAVIKNRKPRDCEMKCPHKMVPHLATLLTHPMCESLYERHLEYLSNYITSSQWGFWMLDLSHLIKVFESLKEKVSQRQMDLYYEPLAELLKVAAIPPLLTKSSDVIEYRPDLAQYFTTLGEILFYVADENIQLTIINSISNVFSRKTKFPICCVGIHHCEEAVKLSFLPERISQCLITVSADVYKELLKLVVILGKISDEICRKMISHDALEFLLIRLEPKWNQRGPQVKPEDPTVDSVVLNYEIVSDILWMFILAIKRSKNDFKNTLTSLWEYPLWSLHYSFRVSLLHSYKPETKNDLLAILIELMDIFKYADFVKSGFATDIAQLAVSTEITPYDPFIANIKFTTKEGDYIFKKTLLLMLPMFLKLCPNVKILLQSKVMLGLLNLLSKEKTIGWLKEQHCSLMLVSLSVVRTLVAALPEDFENYLGIEIVLEILRMYNNENYDVKLFLFGAQLLKTCINVQKPDFTKKIHALGGTEILLVQARRVLNCRLTIPLQQAFSCIFRCLKDLSQDKAILYPGIINLSLDYLDRILTMESSDSNIQIRFIICVLDFTWESVVWCNETLKEFIKKDGIYKLLDLIDYFLLRAVLIKVVALGMLVDICEEELSVPYCITWRGKNGETFLSLLLKIFRGSCKIIGTQMDDNSLILDPENPLMGEFQREVTLNKPTNSSPAILDLLLSLRPKVYALIQILYVRYKDVVEITDECYKMQQKDLSIEDEMTLLLAENYVALKLGEIWKELLHDVIKSGVRPIAIDSMLMMTLIQRAHKWGEYLKESQGDLLRRHNQREMIKEKILFHDMKETFLPDALQAYKEMRFIARTTEKMFRYQIKKTHNEEVQAVMIGGSLPMHKTYMYNLDICPVYNQKISVESNINPRHEKRMDLIPVSPDESFCLEIDNEDRLSTPSGQYPACDDLK